MNFRQKYNLKAFSIGCLFLINICFAYQNGIERIHLIMGGQTELSCNISSNILRWTFNGVTIGPSDKYYFPDENQQILQIQKTTYSDEGEYTCQNMIEGLGRTFLAKGKPRFKISTSQGQMDVKSIHANSGQNIDLKCYIPTRKDIPETERYNFTWYREGKPISQTIYNDRLNKLTITSLEASDYGTYTCFAFNGVQNHTESIQLRIRSKNAYVWPLICIAGELVILVLVICIFDDKDARPEMEESDNDIDNNAVAPIESHKSQEIRQRKL